MGNADLVTALLAAKANPYTEVNSCTPLGWAAKGKGKNTRLGKSGFGRGKDMTSRNYALAVQRLIEAKASPTEGGRGCGNALALALMAFENVIIDRLTPDQLADFTGMMKVMVEAGAISTGKGKNADAALPRVAKGTMKGCKRKGGWKGMPLEGIPPAEGVDVLKSLVKAGARYPKDDEGMCSDFAETLALVHQAIAHEHGEEPPKESKELRVAAEEVLKQVLLAKADVSQVSKGKGKGANGLAEFFDEQAADAPLLKDVATMIREYASTSPETDGNLVAEVAKVLGFDKDEYSKVETS